MKKFILPFLITTVTAYTAYSQRLRTEDFNYASGQLTDFNGGANVSGSNWSHISGGKKLLQVVSGDLTYPDYVTDPAPNSGHLELDTTRTSNSERAFISLDPITSGTIYVSFLLRVNSTATLISHDSASANYFAAFWEGISNISYTNRLYIRQGSAENTYNLGISANRYVRTPVAWVDQDLEVGATVLITMGYQINEGTRNDVAKLWINPPNVSEEPEPQVTSVFERGREFTSIFTFALRQHYRAPLNAGTPKCEVDAIKISQSWEDGTLPLRLLSFNVVDNNGFAKLSWQTANEINMKKFEVQKSEDAQNFTAIGEIAAKNTIAGTTYSFGDQKALAGKAYYRLKMFDNDGGLSYSGLVSIDGKIPAELRLFPNPVTSTLALLHPKAGSNTTVSIIAIGGQTAMRSTIQSGAIQSSIDVSKLAKGSYILVFTNGSKKQTLKFVKQ